MRVYTHFHLLMQRFKTKFENVNKYYTFKVVYLEVLKVFLLNPANKKSQLLVLFQILIYLPWDIIVTFTVHIVDSVKKSRNFDCFPICITTCIIV